MEFRVLGPLQVVDDDRASAPSGAKERKILVRLLVEPGRAVPTDRLLEAAWPGAQPAQAVRSLGVRLAHLRGFLEPDREAGAASSVVLREGDAYRLAIDPDQVDAVRFERLVRAADSQPSDLALAAYDEALALWRGEPFRDIPEDELARIEARRLEELRAHAARRRAQALVELGRGAEAVPELRRLVADAPHDEDLGRTLALALYRGGRQVEALDELRALGERLRELGLDAGVETRELERRVLTHDPELAGTEPSRPAAAARLPRRSSRFFGREAHLSRATELLREGALVTLVGVGGVGKTRLALELAARVSDERSAGPWWCELAPVSANSDVPGAVGSSIGIESGGLDRVAEHIGASAALLVLDNCEHVLEGAGEAVEALLERCPGLVIVATSRAPLGIDGEMVLRLSGLDLPAGRAPDVAEAPAVALFVDRARHAGGVVDIEADLDPIGELCRRLDGLPLAIELAAGRTRSLSPQEIAERLDERFKLLSVSGRRAAARHATLRHAIDWSYELLDAPQQRLFERLAVFSRSCTLDDAEAVCVGDGVEREDVAALLDDLVANSLVTVSVRNGRSAYGLLETLREYGYEQLAARGETAMMRDRHVSHYVQRALDLLGGGWREPRLPLIDEFDDLRAAVRWCLEADDAPDRAFILAEALWWPAPSRHAEEIASLIEEALERWPDPHPWRPRALGAASVARLVIGDAAAAHRLATEAVASESIDEQPALLARRTLAQLAFFARDPADALELWREQSAVARAAGFDALGCEADGFAVQLLQANGDAPAASELAASMRAEADRLASPFMIGWSRYVSGVALIDSDPGGARRWLLDALELSRAADHHHMVRFSLRALGIAAAMENDHAEAARWLLAALEHDEAITDAASQWTTLMALGVVLARKGAVEPAAELLAGAERWPMAPYLAAQAARQRGRIENLIDARALASAEQRGRAATLTETKRRARAALDPSGVGGDH